MLYGSTVDYFPQAIIYLMVSIKAVMFLDLMAIYFMMKADDKTRENNEDENKINNNLGKEPINTANPR